MGSSAGHRVLEHDNKGTLISGKFAELNYVKIEILSSVKVLLGGIKRQVIEWVKMFANYISTHYYLLCMENLQNTIEKKSNNPIRMWRKPLKDMSLKRL